MSSTKDLLSELDPEMELLRDGEFAGLVWLRESVDFGGSDGAVAVPCLGDFWKSYGKAAEAGTPVA